MGLTHGTLILITSECLSEYIDCPACGGAVRLDIEPNQSSSTSLSDAVLGAAPSERIDILRDCRECGWREERRVRVEAIDTTAGDAGAIKWATPLQEITDELTAIEEHETLKDTLADVRRQRLLEQSQMDTDEDAPE